MVHPAPLPDVPVILDGVEAGEPSAAAGRPAQRFMRGSAVTVSGGPLRPEDFRRPYLSEGHAAESPGNHAPMGGTRP